MDRKNKKENSMDEISYREEMINNTLIEAYVLKYTNRNDLPFKIYKMGYVNGYKITISGWQMDNTEELIDNAFKNIKSETNEKSMPDKSKNIAESIESENDRFFKYGLDILANLTKKFIEEKKISQEEAYKYFVSFPFDYYTLFDNHNDYTVMRFPVYEKNVNGKLVLKDILEAIPEENNRIVKYENDYDKENKYNFLNNRDIVELEYEENYNTIICFSKIIQLSEKIRKEKEPRQQEWLYDNYRAELEKYNKIVMKLKEESKKYCETSKEYGLRERLKSILDNDLNNQEKRILSSAEILNIMHCNLMNARNFLDENKESLAKEPTDISKRQRGTYEDFCDCIKQRKYESAYWELVDFVDDYGDSHNNEVSVWESKFLVHEIDDFRSAVEPLLHGITYYRTQNVGDEINFGVLGKYSFSEIESDSDDTIKSVIKLLNENIAVFNSKVLFYMFSNLKDTAYPFWEYNNFYKFLTVKPTWGNTQFSTNIYDIEITPENIMDVLNSKFKFIIMEKIKDDILIKNVNINEDLNMLSIEFEGFCNKFNALIEMDYKNNFEVVSFHAS